MCDMTAKCWKGIVQHAKNRRESDYASSENGHARVSRLHDEKSRSEIDVGASAQRADSC